MEVDKMNTCYLCDSTTTYVYKGREIWRIHDGYKICRKCYDKWIWAPVRNPKWNPINNKKWNKLTHQKYGPMRIQFRDKRLRLKISPRTGICSNCNRSVHNGDIKRTNLHHLNYDINNPLANTIELCIGCHNRQHPEKYIK